MRNWLNNLHKKNELNFALAWIGIYCVINSIANSVSAMIGIHSSATFAVNLILTVMMYQWIKKEGLEKYYGLCKTNVPAKKFLWYIPVILFMFRNLMFGLTTNLPAVDTVFYILSMFLVGFLEEVIFRGFLFKALAKDNVKMAIIVSSVTFGFGHIINLFNGSGMELVENVCQIMGAVACGFLFVIIFHRGGSLIPCIIAHSVNNALSVFASEEGLTAEKHLLISAGVAIIVIAFTLILTKTLPKAQDEV